MPIYEYRCSQCGTEKEYLQKLSDAPITDCPACGNATMVKLVSPAGFQLKGTGWYATDFKQGNKRKPADGGKSEGAEKGEGAKADSAEGTGKSEAAPACGAGACPACQ
jgi:putative FmdB family regulatory protein